MIIKFDHLTYASTPSIPKPEILNNYCRKFICSAENLPIKKTHMDNFSQHHQLIMFEPLDNSSLPVELTIYNQIEARKYQVLEYDGLNTIIINSFNPQLTKHLFLDLGFIDIGCSLQFSSLFAPQKVNIILRHSPHNQETTWLLDEEGWCGMAFVCSNIYNEHRRLSAKYNCTDIDTLLVNDKHIDLFFVEGKCGEFIEIFSPQRRTNENNRS